MARAKPELRDASVTGWAFETPIGWIALACNGQEVLKVRLGHPRQDAALAALGLEAWQIARLAPRSARSWQAAIEQMLNGSPTDIRDIPVRVAPADTFTGIVQRLCREIPWGRTMTYRDLAAEAGAAGAARAVGNVMRTNELPLLIPCHRVVGVNGLGGYSAPRGLALKKRLLELEARSPQAGFPG